MSADDVRPATVADTDRLAIAQVITPDGHGLIIAGLWALADMTASRLVGMPTVPGDTGQRAHELADLLRTCGALVITARTDSVTQL